MLNPRKTVDLIISTLRHKENLGDPFALRSIAEDYATLCADVVARLDQCKTLLANRDEFGAWTLLATPPELFELIEILGFAQLGEWRELCLKNALPVAAEFDAYTIEKLEKLYSSKYIKNISENHFLYAAYRRAMRLKNEDDAFRSLNAIVRANPHDTTSRTAYRAIEDKQQRKLIAKLKEKLDVVTANETPENITAALDALAEIEQTIWQDPPVSKTLDAGRALAEKVELAEALETARKFLDNANSLAADGHHIVAESYLVEFDALAKKHAFVLSPAEQAKLQTLRETLASAAAHRAKVEKQRKVVAALETELARQESLLSVHTRKIPVLEKDQTTVVHLWKELETLAIPVTEQLHNRYQKVIENTDIEISRKRRNRVISIVAAILLGISATGAGAFYLYETNEITKLAQKCAEAPKSNSVPVAEGILALAEKHPRRAATATVAPALAQLREWVARNKQLFATYTAQKTTAGDAINKVTPDASFEVVSTAETAFSTLDAAFKKLAANYQKSEELPLADLRVAWDGKRATWETEMHNRFAAKIQHHEQRINYAKKESTYLKSIEKDGEKVVTRHGLLAWIPGLKSKQEELRAEERRFEHHKIRRPEETARLNATEEDIKTFSDAETAYRDAANSTANSLEEYKRQLEAFAALALKTDPRVDAAKIVLSYWDKCDNEFLKLEHLAPANPSMQAILKKEATDGHFDKPFAQRSGFEITTPERRILNELARIIPPETNGDFSRFRQGIKKWWKVPYCYGKSQRGDWGHGNEKTFKYIAFTGAKIGNEQREIKFPSISAKREPVEEETLFVKKYFGEENVIRTLPFIRISPVRILDELNVHLKKETLDPVFAATITNYLFTLIDQNPLKWRIKSGGAYTTYSKKVKDIFKNSELDLYDWLRGRDLWRRHGDALEAFVALEKPTNLWEASCAEDNRYRNIMRGNFLYVGFVGLDNKVNLIAKHATAGEIWTFDKDGSILKFVIKGNGTLLNSSAQPSAPIFTFVPENQ